MFEGPRRSRRLATLVAAACVGGAGLGLLAPVPARAGNEIPCGDSAALIDAIKAANKRGNGSIELGGGCTYELILPNNTSGNGPNGLPVVKANLIVEGNGATIRRQQSGGFFRILEVAKGAKVSIDDLTIEGGTAGSGFSPPDKLGVDGAAGGGAGADAAQGAKGGKGHDGGGIRNAGTLVLEHVTMRYNAAGTGGHGGTSKGGRGGPGGVGGNGGNGGAGSGGDGGPGGNGGAVFNEGRLTVSQGSLFAENDAGLGGLGGLGAGGAGGHGGAGGAGQAGGSGGRGGPGFGGLGGFGGHGGAIANTGVLLVEDSKLVDNDAGAGQFGGPSEGGRGGNGGAGGSGGQIGGGAGSGGNGVGEDGGLGGNGGAFAALGGTLRIDNSVISGNVAGLGGRGSTGVGGNGGTGGAGGAGAGVAGPGGPGGGGFGGTGTRGGDGGGGYVTKGTVDIDETRIIDNVAGGGGIGGLGVGGNGGTGGGSSGGTGGAGGAGGTGQAGNGGSGIGHGGGLALVGGETTIDDSRVVNNTAGAAGGAGGPAAGGAGGAGGPGVASGAAGAAGSTVGASPGAAASGTGDDIWQPGGSLQVSSSKIGDCVGTGCP